MKKVEIQFNRMDEAISVMKEVASWGRGQGYRVWPDAPKYEAAYLHKFCVRRKFAGMGMAKVVITPSFPMTHQ